MVYYTTDNNFGTAKWIVDATAGQGTHTTIAAALTSASSGDTIFIRPGTYTENLTLKDGVNLVAYSADALTPNVTISGKATFTAAGTVSFSGIQLVTNSDFFLAVTGSAASAVNFLNCVLRASNNTGISFTSSSSSARISIINSIGNISTTGITYFVSTSAGQIIIQESFLNNAGGSVTPSSTSTGSINLYNSSFLVPLSTSSTGTVNAFNCYFTAPDATSLTTAGTGTSQLSNCFISSGTASTLSAGAGTTIQCFTCTVSSSNTNAITGAGSVTYGGIQLSSSKIINTTTQAVANGSTFTPVLKFGGATTGITYSTQYGKYLRVDNMVTFVIALTLTSKGTAVGNATITGLPFTSQNDGGSYDFPNTYITITAATATYFFADLGANSSTLGLYFGTATTGGFTALADTNFANTTIVRIIGSYFI